MRTWPSDRIGGAFDLELLEQARIDLEDAPLMDIYAQNASLKFIFEAFRDKKRASLRVVESWVKVSASSTSD